MCCESDKMPSKRRGTATIQKHQRTFAQLPHECSQCAIIHRVPSSANSSLKLAKPFMFDDGTSSFTAPSTFHRNDSGRPSTAENEEEIRSGSSDQLIWQRIGRRHHRPSANSPSDFYGFVDDTEAEHYGDSIWWPMSASYNSAPLFQTKQFISKQEPINKWRQCCTSLPPSGRFLVPILIVLLALSIVLLIAVLALIAHQQAILHARLTNTRESYDRLLRENKEKQNQISLELMSLFNETRIRQNLYWISSKVHIAGTKEQLELMDGLAHQYRQLGFDVRLYDYDEVLLSVPNYERPNTVHSWNDRLSRWELISDGIGRPAKHIRFYPELNDQLEDDPRMHYWWNAYSANGTVLGELVYANYGTREDFELLEKWNISVNGKILLIRYGSIFRGEKVRLAEARNAIGVILYSDPFDYMPGNMSFPEDPWLPPMASQRGTVYDGTGDPETPSPLPSTPYAHRPYTERQLRHELGILPRIPVTSIGYANVHKLFYRMDGPIVPWSRWAGSLPVPYRLSGSMLVRLYVRTRTERRPIRNFIALMPGREEPDRWVMVGNHADAWTKGSIDPGTGTSTMLEMARVLASYSARTGWKPRRTIAFCQWDAEEFGLIGSTEWVEQYLRLVQQRAIAYINVDNLNGNNTLVVKSVPSLYRLITDAASRVSQPVQSELISVRQTLLDSWRFHNPRPTLPGDRSVPFIQHPHSGSDFQPFIAYAGIPVADLRLESAPQYTYMLYHTAYEVPWVNDRFVDPEGNTSVAMGQFWLEITRSLADNMIIPFNVEDYGIALHEYINKADTQMRSIGIHKALGENFYNEKFAFLEQSVKQFQMASVKFQRIIQSINSGDMEVSVRDREQLNHRLQTLEQCFILDRGLSDKRIAFRHAIFSAPQEAENSGLALPVLLDPAAKWLSSRRRHGDSSGAAHLEQLRWGFSLLQWCVECGTETLNLRSNDEERREESRKS